MILFAIVATEAKRDEHNAPHYIAVPTFYVKAENAEEAERVARQILNAGNAADQRMIELMSYAV